MSSQAQITANQTNAAQSTGPNTSEGKAASSHNATSHGLSGHNFRVQNWESQAHYVSLLSGLFVEFRPQTTLEKELVESLAEHRWLVQRALRLQEGCFHTDLAYCDDPIALALYLRYQTTHERAASKALRELQNLQQQRKKAEIGFVSQKDAQAAQVRVQEQHELSKQLKQTTLRLQFARLQRVESDNLHREVPCAVGQSISHAPQPAPNSGTGFEIPARQAL